MTRTDRRRFLQAAAGATGASFIPGLIGRALAIPANNATGSIRDIEHIVVFMQENRSFDHYFGMLNGVRGFGDPRPLRLPGGQTVWRQPSKEHPDGYVMPYHGDSRTTRSFLVDGSDQSHQANLTIRHRGAYDRWGDTGELHQRMLHYGPGDLPFYYALANAFTICDAYHCSTLTQTYPNRLHLFTGCNGGGGVGGDPEMDNYGEDLTPSADMAQDKPLRADAYQWTTYAERLEKAGVSWRVYQEYDNFGDNLLSVFPAFRPCPVDSSLYRRGRSWVSEDKTGPDRERSDGEQLVAAFRKDLADGTLPQVSWIVTSTDLSEHPKAVPAKGEHICARLIEALVDHPEMFAKTAFIINYDEAGGFYDHALPPVPAIAAGDGFSTVSVDGEIKDYGARSVANPGAQPIGLGIRIPGMVVSPWSRGGYVCSQLFDHTSVIRLIEARFGVREPNISAWRRSVCGDLTSAFDFTSPNRDWAGLGLPGTDDFMNRVERSKIGTANAIPAVQQPTRQMPGQRPARPLPYDFAAVGMVTPQRRFRLAMRNPGPVGVVLSVHDQSDRQQPWSYTIGARDAHDSEQWHDAGPIDRYDLAVHGPNGFYQEYAGSLGPDAPLAEALLMPAGPDGAVRIALINNGATPLSYVVSLDPAYRSGSSGGEQRISVPGGQQTVSTWPVAGNDGWYDIAVSLADVAGLRRRFAGFAGAAGGRYRTDPAIGAMRTGGDRVA